MINWLSGAIGAVLILGGISGLVVAWRIFSARPNDFNAAHERTGSPWTAMRGALNTSRDGNRDHRVAAGISLDVRRGVWRAEGKLADEMVDALVKKA